MAPPNSRPASKIRGNNPETRTAIIHSATGTGKMFAYLLPITQMMLQHQNNPQQSQQQEPSQQRQQKHQRQKHQHQHQHQPVSAVAIYPTLTLAVQAHSVMLQIVQGLNNQQQQQQQQQQHQISNKGAVNISPVVLGIASSSTNTTTASSNTVVFATPSTFAAAIERRGNLEKKENQEAWAWLDSLKCVVVDEADYILKPRSRYAIGIESSKKAQLAVATIGSSFVTSQNPLFVFVSATVNNPLRRAVQYGPWNPNTHTNTTTPPPPLILASTTAMPHTISHTISTVPSSTTFHFNDPKHVGGKFLGLWNAHNQPLSVLVLVAADFPIASLVTFLEERGVACEAVTTASARKLSPVPRANTTTTNNNNNNTMSIYVTTLSIARGMDFSSTTHVFSFVPVPSPVDYVHIAGRTGRAGRSGVVVSVVEADRVKDFEKMLNLLGVGVAVEKRGGGSETR